MLRGKLLPWNLSYTVLSSSPNYCYSSFDECVLCAANTQSHPGVVKSVENDAYIKTCVAFVVRAYSRHVGGRYLAAGDDTRKLRSVLTECNSSVM